jgi:hypothetical protein
LKTSRNFAGSRSEADGSDPSGATLPPLCLPDRADLCDWITRFILFFGATRHPKDMGKTEIEVFLSHLAIQGNVAASTQRQALNALFFYTGMSLSTG